jgi:hypothetical protein
MVSKILYKKPLRVDFEFVDEKRHVNAPVDIYGFLGVLNIC